MRLRLFNEGLNTRQDSRLIAPTEAVECENVDTSSGIIKSAKGLEETDITADNKPVFFESNDSWEDKVGPLTYLEYQKKLYWTATDKAQKYDGEIQQNLGIERPDVSPKLTSLEPVAIPPTGLTLLGKTYTYTISFALVAGSHSSSPDTDWINFELFILDDPSDDGELVVVQYHEQRVYGIDINTDVEVDIQGAGGTGSLHILLALYGDEKFYVFKGGSIAPDEIWDEGAPAYYSKSFQTVTAPEVGITPWLEEGRVYDIAAAVESADGRYMSILEEASHTVLANELSIEVTVTAVIGDDVHFYIKGLDGYWYIWETEGLVATTKKVNIFGDWTLSYRNIEDISVNPDTGIITVTVDTDPEYPLKGGYCYISDVHGMTELNGKNYRVSYPDPNNPKIFTLRTLDIVNTYIDGTTFSPYVKGGRVYNGRYISSEIEGTYGYIYTYYNAKDGTESSASVISEEVLVTLGEVATLRFESSLDPQVTAINIYRLGNTLLDFTLIDSILASFNSYTDHTPDSEVAGTLYDADLNGAPPSGLQYIKQIYGVFLGAVGEKLYYSRDIGNPNYWPQAYYINFPTIITGIGVTGSRVVIFTKYKTYGLSGSSARNFVKYGISGDQGCLNHETIAEKGNTLLFISSDGLCALTGSTVQLMSKMKLGKQTFDTVNAVIHDETYYLQLTNGKILAFDFRYEPCIKYYDFGTDYLVVGEDVLYGRKDGKLHKLFEGDEVPFTYKTGRLTDGGNSELKTYDKLYLSWEDDITVEIFIDGKSKKTKDLSTLRNKLRETTILQSDMLGYDIQFKFTGIGSVAELEYKVGDRENGK